VIIQVDIIYLYMTNLDLIHIVQMHDLYASFQKNFWII